MGSQRGQGPAEFGLENDDERDDQNLRQAFEDGADDGQAEDLRQKHDREENDHQADEHAGARRAFEEAPGVVDRDREQADFEDVLPVPGNQVESVHASASVPRMASVMRKPSIFERTSWTR